MNQNFEDISNIIYDIIWTEEDPNLVSVTMNTTINYKNGNIINDGYCSIAIKQ